MTKFITNWKEMGERLTLDFWFTLASAILLYSGVTTMSNFFDESCRPYPQDSSSSMSLTLTLDTKPNLPLGQHRNSAKVQNRENLTRSLKVALKERVIKRARYQRREIINIKRWVLNVGGGGCGEGQGVLCLRSSLQSSTRLFELTPISLFSPLSPSGRRHLRR